MSYLFASHGSGAPGLEPISSIYVDMVDYIFNKTSWVYGYDNRAERIYLSATILKECYIYWTKSLLNYRSIALKLTNLFLVHLNI